MCKYFNPSFSSFEYFAPTLLFFCNTTLNHQKNLLHPPNQAKEHRPQRNPTPVRSHAMCVVQPVTYPCCRKQYVLVSKCPGCPEDWPKSKCPPEFAIQINQWEPEERVTGVCWRCQADEAGESGLDREKRRPGIDMSTVLWDTVKERRSRIESQGYCWFCNAKGGCSGCGSLRIPLEGRPSAGNNPHQQGRCWYCGAHTQCQTCEIREDPLEVPVKVKKESSPAVSATSSVKKSRAGTPSKSRSGIYMGKRVKAEPHEEKSFFRASVPVDPRISRHRSGTLKRHAASQLHSSSLPSSGFTNGGYLGTASDGGFAQQDFSPDLGSTSSSWQAVNHLDGGMGPSNQFSDWGLFDEQGKAAEMASDQHFQFENANFDDSPGTSFDPLYSEGDFDTFPELDPLLDSHENSISITVNPADLQLDPALGYNTFRKR